MEVGSEYVVGGGQGRNPRALANRRHRRLVEGSRAPPRPRPRTRARDGPPGLSAGVPRADEPAPARETRGAGAAAQGSGPESRGGGRAWTTRACAAAPASALKGRYQWTRPRAAAVAGHTLPRGRGVWSGSVVPAPYLPRKWTTGRGHHRPSCRRGSGVEEGRGRGGARRRRGSTVGPAAAGAGGLRGGGAGARRRGAFASARRRPLRARNHYTGRPAAGPRCRGGAGLGPARDRLSTALAPATYCRSPVKRPLGRVLSSRHRRKP